MIYYDRAYWNCELTFIFEFSVLILILALVILRASINFIIFNIYIHL